MRRSAVAVLATTAVFCSPVGAADPFKLPPEVTPALRAACESDVRRLCVGDNPTIEKVKTCVERKYFQLGARCKAELVSAGLAP